MNRAHTLLVFCLAIGAAACGSRAATNAPPSSQAIVQPGAPGEATRAIDADDAVTLSRTQATAADIRFMQNMIAHHAQALEMTQLIASRTMNETIRLLGRRIELSQVDEIDLMRHWLRAHGQPVPEGHVHELMPGMLMPDEMDRLARARNDEFDRLFLEGMIKHHAGAIIMVKELFDTPGAGEDADIFAFASDVDVDQRIEIGRMGTLLEELQK